MYSLAPSHVDGSADFYFDSSRRTRTLCKAGLVVCWLAGLTELGVGIWLVRVRGGDYLNLNQYTKEILPLGLNILVTMVNETLGCIHTSSLRWALQREGHLAFNSNLRLFASVRTSKANAWYSNMVMFLCIVMSYASTSTIFMGDVQIGGVNNGYGDAAHPYSLLPANYTSFVCGYALVTLAIGILGQCTIATAALRSAVSCPTWSPNPIDTAAACAVSGAVHVVPGRCLRSVHDQEQASSPVCPSSRQQSAYRAHKEVRYVFFFLWSTVVLTLVWGGVLIAVIGKESLVNGMYYGQRWSFFPFIPSSVDLRVASAQAPDGNTDTSGTMTLAIPWKIIGQFSWQDTENPYVSFPSFCWAFALVCLLQAVMTFGLHCAELLVNVVRDEKTWRRAGSRSSSSGGLNSEPGLSRKPTNALHMLLVSGPALTLFLLKPVLHWMFGLAISTYFSVGLVMRPPQIFYLSVGVLLLALFVSACAFWRPKGPQPATFGHLQTLVNLVDEWPEMGETMFWGRKSGVKVVEREREEESLQAGVEGAGGGMPERAGLIREKLVAHAGTSATKLEEVRFDEVYMGIWNRYITKMNCVL